MRGGFLRGLIWGGLLGILAGAYWTAADGGLRIRRQRFGREDEADGASQRPASALQLVTEAGRAALDAALALLGRRV